MESLYRTKRNQKRIGLSAELMPVTAIGELNVDLLLTGLNVFPQLGREVLATDFEMVLGSASAIFASGLARLGHPINFYSKVGDDAFGHFCRTALEKMGISISNIVASKSSRSGVTVALSMTSDRALATFLGAIAELGYEDLPHNALDGSSHLHLTSYFLQHRLRPSFVRLFRDAHQRGITTSFDPNSDPSESWSAEIWDVIQETDILFVNEVEALSLSRQSTVQSALNHLSGKASCVVIKLGAKGAIGSADKEIVSVPPFRIFPVDTTGAGDSFAAGFVHAHLLGKDLRDCLIAGSACGALSALKPGGTAGQPTQPELAAFIAQSLIGQSGDTR
jgi:sugar/nucleoside kinase (ribokinase family)